MILCWIHALSMVLTKKTIEGPWEYAGGMKKGGAENADRDGVQEKGDSKC